jgi:hypothetical protein
MPKLPGVHHLDAITMAGIIRDAGMSIEEFRKLL